MKASEDRKQIPSFGVLKAFEAAGQVSGIRRAAQLLELDHAVISRHLRTLEEWAGVPLINRSRQGNFLTAEGIRYHQRITAALEEISRAGAELSQSRQDGRLHLWCIPGFASQWLTSRIHNFQGMHPDIELELHPTDSSPDFTSYQADADIRYVAGRPGQHSSAVTRRFEIARPPVLAVANPEYAATLPQIRCPEDLLTVPLLHEENTLQWQAWFTSHGVQVTLPLRGPRLWHAHLTLDAARHGQGIALANTLLLRDDFASGRLVPLGTDPYGRNEAGHQAVLGAYVFTARADRWQSRAVAQFRLWLRQSMPGDMRHMGHPRTYSSQT